MYKYLKIKRIVNKNLGKRPIMNDKYGTKNVRRTVTRINYRSVEGTDKKRRKE